MIFPLKEYNKNNLYILNNGYYLDPKQVPGEDENRIFFQIKSPEGAVLEINNPIFTLGTQADNSTIIKESVEAIISALSTELDFDGLTLQEIVQKQEPPPIPKNGIFKIIGKVVDEDNTPLQNVKIEPFLLELPPSSPNPQEEAIIANFQALPSAILINPDKIPFTDENGGFEYIYEQGSGINFDQSYITCTKDNYFPKQVGPKLLKTGEETVKEKEPNSTTEESVIYDIYDLGKIILQPTELNLEKEEAKLNAEVQELENLEIEFAGKLSLPFEVRLTNIFSKKKENLKRTLFPAIIALLVKFGPNIVHSILSKAKNPLADKVCPTPEELLEILKKRNRLVRQLNNIYKVVRVIARVLKITSALIIGLKIGLRAAQIASAIPPGKFAWSGVIESTFKQIDKRLEIAGIAVTILSISAATIGATLALIIQLLRQLDLLIQECAEEINPATSNSGTDGTVEVGDDGVLVDSRNPQGGPIGNQGGPIGNANLFNNLATSGESNIPFVEVNDEINSFIDSTTGQEDDLIDPLTGNPLPYRGFTFEIKQDTSQNFKYPKRFAIARNIQGIQVLRSESSFASSPQILIEELKFVIDRDNLRAD